MNDWTVHNPGGGRRVVVTKQLPGDRWLEILKAADCSVEVCRSDAVLTVDEIKERIGESCDGVIGQLTEDWNADLFAVLGRDPRSVIGYRHLYCIADLRDSHLD